MIPLSKKEPFAVGGRRACYFHPDDPNRCIKVALSDKQPEQLRSEDPWWKRLRPASYYDENELDIRIYARLEAKLGALAGVHFPNVYGLVKTDLGQGLETELIRDTDGRVSLSGKEYTMLNGRSDASEYAIQQLSDFLVQHLLLFRDPFPHNIAMQEQPDGSLRVIIIDGLSRKTFLSPSFRKASEKRILRKVERLKKGLKRAEHNGRKGVQPKPNGMLAAR